MKEFSAKMANRTKRIGNVTDSMSRINDMFTNLNEIVVQQGQTLTRLEDNIGETRENTKGTNEELKEAVKYESKTLTERLMDNPLLGGKGSITGDISTTCLLVWFFFALAMFLVDFSGDDEAAAAMVAP